MFWSKNKKILVLLCSTIIAIVASFTITGNVYGKSEAVVKSDTPSSQLSPNEILNQKGFVQVTTIDDASKLVGFKVATPSSLPENFQLRSITVSQGKNVDIKRTEQSWVSKDRESILVLYNAPKLQGIGEGEHIEKSGFVGDRAFFGVDSNRKVPMVVLYWQGEKDMAYMLIGTMSDSLNEDILYKIALSVKTK
jgi:hypothetical protein